jgi:hypothetical protein
MARRLTKRRRVLLARLAEMHHELGGDRFARVLYGELLDALLADRMHWKTAARIALRRTRLAVLLLAGREQQVAARQLDVGPRTGKSDAQAIRRAVLLWRTRRRLEAPALERVPLVPEDLPPERRRARR